MIFYPGDVCNLSMDIDICISKVIEFDPDDLKKFLAQCAREYLEKGDNDES